MNQLQLLEICKGLNCDKINCDTLSLRVAIRNMAILLNIPEVSGHYTRHELTFIPKDKGGVYCFYSEDQELLYIGKSLHLKHRISLHLSGKTNAKDFQDEFYYVETYYIKDKMEMDILEIYMINTLKPRYNVLQNYSIENDMDGYEENNYLVHIDKGQKNTLIDTTNTLMIDHELFTKLRNINKCTGAEKRSISTQLYNLIKNSFNQETWIKMKDNTKNAINFYCWLGSETGMVFSSPEFVGEKYNVSARMIRNVMNNLVENGFLVKGNRKHKDRNGKGKVVYFFVKHPNYLEIENLIYNYANR